MRAHAKMVLLLGSVAAMMALPGKAFAQGQVTCESNNGQRQYCGRYHRDEVRMERQLSESPCVRGRTWGVDDDGLWVDQGCRAQFSIGQYGDEDDQEGMAGPAEGGRRIRCESEDGERKYCGQYDRDEVRMARQISGTPCVWDRTWGVNGRGLWVDHGCRAEFVIGQFRYRDEEQGMGGPGPGMDQGGQQVRCSSDDGERHYCGQYGQEEVRLQQQISGSPCEPGRSWGVDDRGLWVDHGCRAVFLIGGGGYYGQREREQPEWMRQRDDDRWPPSGNWQGGGWQSGGACFFKDRNFRGDYFCLHRGERVRSMGSYGDDISSIRVFGGALVTVYNDRNYRNGQDTTDHTIRDLRNWRMTTRPSHSWNNRISSVAVH